MLVNKRAAGGEGGFLNMVSDKRLMIEILEYLVVVEEKNDIL